MIKSEHNSKVSNVNWGWTIFGTTYGVTAASIVALGSSGSEIALVPVIGPLIRAAQNSACTYSSGSYINSCSSKSASVAPLALSTVLQAIGLGMVWLNFPSDEVEVSSASTNKPKEVSLFTPTVFKDGLGATFQF